MDGVESLLATISISETEMLKPICSTKTCYVNVHVPFGHAFGTF